VAETTTQKIRDYLGGLVGVSDGTIDIHREDAEDIVIGDGIGIEEKVFERAHRYMASHSLTLDGHYQEVASESVEDTSRSNVTNPRTEGNTSFSIKYDEILTKKFGLGERIGVDV